MTTPLLNLPEIAENQSGKYITHNQALHQLEAGFRLLDITLSTPPGSPASGNTYYVYDDAVATGDWAGFEGSVAHYISGVWYFYAAFDGLTMWVVSDSTQRVFDSTQAAGSKWVVLSYFTNIIDDTTPQLGSDLDMNGQSIVTLSNADVSIVPDGTGAISVSGTTDYETNVTDDDDIPNKKYVDDSKSVTPINTQTGTTYGPVLADAGYMITLNNVSAITVTIPANGSVAYPVGTVLSFMQLGAGQVTITITTDALNYSSVLTNNLYGQYAVASAHKVTSTGWILFGNLELA